MLKIVTAITLTFCYFASVMSHPGRPVLPLCTQDQGDAAETKLHCIVYSDQFLDFNEIRTFTASLNKKFNVSINCYNGGKIRLPWPFFAKNLVTLQVSDCIIEGFLSERSEPQTYPNELKQVFLSNSKIKVNVRELHDSILNLTTMSTDFDCGHTNAEVSIIRNTEYVFPPFSGAMDELILMEELMSSLTLKELLIHDSVCRYEQLRYLEESGSRSFSRYHMKLMETSQYPNLETYSLRNNSLTSVPVELENLRSSFLPKLSVLDLSHNGIQRINFVFSQHNKKSLLIDLKGNLLRVLNKLQLQEIQRTEGIVLDIRENPLECTCELFKYGQYLLKKPKNVIASDIYRGITCQFNKNGAVLQRRLYDTELQNLCPV